MRFFPGVDDWGRWGVYDGTQSFLLPAVRYPSREAAEAYADRLNAITEGESDSVVEDLRYDSDQVR